MPLPRLVGLAFLSAGLTSCRVSMPSPDEWLRIGFHSPEQALFTFQVAVRADEPELEYRCLSEDFRARNRISKIGWREAREELRRRYPFLAYGIADAQVVGTITVLGDRASALWETHGQWIQLALRREDFAELRAGEEIVSDGFVSFDEFTSIQVGADGRRWFQGSVALPPGAPTVTDMHVGREWKIDSFESVDPPREAARSSAQAPSETRHD